MDKWFWCIVAFLFGVNIGSFLNVVIWRLPRNGSLVSPKHSYCPSCNRQLTVIDLVPLFSFLFLGCKCRTCKKPISWRYFTVELLTGLVFAGFAWRFSGSAADAVALMAFASLLIPASFIDLDFYLIPVSLNLLAFAVAIARDVYGIVLHEPSHRVLWGWLPISILGALVGIGIFGAVRVVGWLWKKTEAMGLGDVLLARAMGALLVQVVVPGAWLFRLFPAWVLLSCLTGIVFGIPTLLRAGRQQQDPVDQESPGNVSSVLEGKNGQAVEDIAQSDEEPSTLKAQLLDIGYCVWLGDLVDYIRHFGKPDPEAEDDFVPEPTAIPFGPFLAIGFLATMFYGELLTHWYIAYAIPKPGQ